MIRNKRTPKGRGLCLAMLAASAAVTAGVIVPASAAVAAVPDSSAAGIREGAISCGGLWLPHGGYPMLAAPAHGKASYFGTLPDACRHSF